MSYQVLIQRLSDVRLDIRNLNSVRTGDVQEKIQVLKAVNTLLREQNDLLNMRQQFLDKQKKENLMHSIAS